MVVTKPAKKTPRPLDRKLLFRTLAGLLAFGVCMALLYFLLSLRSSAQRKFTAPVWRSAGGSSSLAIGPGSRLSLVAWGGEIKLCETATGRCLRRWQAYPKEEGITSVAFGPDGWRALSGGTDKAVKLWDITTGECLQTLRGHTGDIHCVAFTPDGRRGLSSSGSPDRAIRLWDLETGECLWTMRGDELGPVHSVVASPDGRHALSGGLDGMVRLWDLESGRCLRTMSEVSDEIYFVTLSPDGRRGLSSTQDCQLMLWDIETGTCLKTLRGWGPAAFSPSGRFFFSQVEKSAISLWDTETYQEIGRFTGYEGYVRDFTISPNGRYVLACGEDKQSGKLECFLWLVPTEAELWAWRLLGGKLPEPPTEARE